MRYPKVAFGSGFARALPAFTEAKGGKKSKGKSKKGGKWIAKALKPRTTKGGRRGKGTLTRAAKAAGMTIAQYCENPPSKLAAKRCGLWRNLQKISRKKKK